MAAASEFLPLSPASFHILLALSQGSKHGYGIMKEVEAASSGAVRLNPGTLYTTIRRLLEDDLIRETEPPSGSDSTDERRRYYGITRLGRQVAQAEMTRLHDLVQQAATALRVRPAD